MQVSPKAEMLLAREAGKRPEARLPNALFKPQPEMGMGNPSPRAGRMVTTAVLVER